MYELMKVQVWDYLLGSLKVYVETYTDPVVAQARLEYFCLYSRYVGR
jgi:hypothetical protein